MCKILLHALWKEIFILEKREEFPPPYTLTRNLKKYLGTSYLVQYNSHY